MSLKGRIIKTSLFLYFYFKILFSRVFILHIQGGKHLKYATIKFMYGCRCSYKTGICVYISYYELQKETTVIALGGEMWKLVIISRKLLGIWKQKSIRKLFSVVGLVRNYTSCALAEIESEKCRCLCCQFAHFFWQERTTCDRQ